MKSAQALQDVLRALALPAAAVSVVIVMLAWPAASPALAGGATRDRVTQADGGGQGAPDAPVTPDDASARGRQGRAAGAGRALRGMPAAGPNDGVSAAEAELLFDRVVLNQAKRVLALDPEQFAAFRPRLQRLQALRRRTQIERLVLVRELAQLDSATPVDETVIKARLDALKAFDTRNTADIQQAYVEIDQTLTPAQQARFRVFEENMARQKQNLINRARQEANQTRPRQAP